MYGCGKKYNGTGEISSLWTGAFVEVPGPASKVRSGNEICETHYRGWQMDTIGNWQPINTMIGSTGQNNESFRDWKIDGNKFSMQMGGWREPGIEKKTLALSSPDPLPNYLKDNYLNELYKMPANFEHLEPIEVSTNSVKLVFNVSDLGTHASAELFWDIEEGLTKEEKWGNKKSILINTNKNEVVLDNLDAGTNYFYRIRITNDQGIIWSYNTQKFETL